MESEDLSGDDASDGRSNVLTPKRISAREVINFFIICTCPLKTKNCVTDAIISGM